MESIKKVINSKIIIWLAALSFIACNTAYGRNAPLDTNLRKPLASGKVERASFDQRFLTKISQPMPNEQAEKYENLMRQFWKNFAKSLEGGVRTEDLEFLKYWRDSTGKDVQTYAAGYDLSIPHESLLWKRLVLFQQKIFNMLPFDLQEKITLFGPERFHITVGNTLRSTDHPYSEEEIQSMVKSLDKVASGVKAAEFDIRGLNAFPAGFLFAQAYPIFDVEGEFEFDKFEGLIAEKSPHALHYDSTVYHITLGFITGELTPEESKRLVKILSKFRLERLGKFRAKKMNLNYFSNLLSPDRILKTYILKEKNGARLVPYKDADLLEIDRKIPAKESQTSL